MDYAIFPPEEIPDADVVVAMPPSKSIANRTLLLGALAGQGALGVAGAEADDVRVMKEALEAYLREPQKPHTFDLGLAGTAMRFLTAYFASQPGAEVTLTGTERMRQRPVGRLVEALRSCGAVIDYVETQGCPPLRISGRKLAGGQVDIDPTVSSQFVSALLMVAPTMERGLELTLTGEPVSMPYILMTIAMMERRGVEVEREPLRLRVAPGQYAPMAPEEEGDWSAASYWYELTAVQSGWYTLANLSEASLQGDRLAARWFGELGVVTSPSEETPGGLDLQPSPEVYGRLTLDLSDTPDLAPALVVAACLMAVPFHLTGLKTLVGKETDRLSALQTEMGRLGLQLELIRDHGIEWDGRRRPITSLPVFETYGDHRMAMALAPASVFVPGIIIRGAECVAKSYPHYWDDLRGAGFRVVEVNVDELRRKAAEGKEGEDGQ